MRSSPTAGTAKIVLHCSTRLNLVILCDAAGVAALTLFEKISYFLSMRKGCRQRIGQRSAGTLKFFALTLTVA